MSLPLLFPGVPGGVELLVILFISSMLLIVPLGLVVAAYLFGKRRGQLTSEDEDATEGVE